MPTQNELISNPSMSIAKALIEAGFKQANGIGADVSNGQFSISKDKDGRDVFHVGFAKTNGPDANNPSITGNALNRVIGNKMHELREAGGVFTQPVGVIGKGWEAPGHYKGEYTTGGVMEFAVASPEKLKEINAASMIDSFKSAIPMNDNKPKLDTGMKLC